MCFEPMGCGSPGGGHAPGAVGLCEHHRVTIVDVVHSHGVTQLVRNGGIRMPAVGKYWSDAQIEALVAYFKLGNGGAGGG